MLTWVDSEDPFPPVSTALHTPNGLLAAGRSLTVPQLRRAYQQGIFPWFSPGDPVLWWSPDPRMVLFSEEIRITRSLVKTLRRIRREQRWTVAFDQDFEGVIQACSEPRPGQQGTWITPKIRAAYTGLHRQGEAHSVEIRESGTLIGGLYGVSMGRMFFGESMFSRRSDASKCALVVLVSTLRPLGFEMIDCQQETAHLASMGGREIARPQFLASLQTLMAQPGPDWSTLRPEFPDL